MNKRAIPPFSPYDRDGIGLTERLHSLSCRKKRAIPPFTTYDRDGIRATERFHTLSSTKTVGIDWMGEFPASLSCCCPSIMQNLHSKARPDISNPHQLSTEPVPQQSSRRKTKVVFFLLSFSDLSHHRTCRSAYGGSSLFSAL